MRYRSRRPDDAAVRARLRELAAVRRRFGYRRLHILLTREGIVMNHKKLRRLYREERLQVRRRGGRKRAWAHERRWRCRKAESALEPRLPVGCILPTAGASASWRSSTTSRANAWRWSPTRRCPGLRVARELDAIIAARGRPAMIVSDNGTELTSMAILRWSQEHARSNGTTSRQASRRRMPSSRASTADCATSC